MPRKLPHLDKLWELLSYLCTVWHGERHVIFVLTRLRADVAFGAIARLIQWRAGKWIFKARSYSSAALLFWLSRLADFLSGCHTCLPACVSVWLAAPCLSAWLPSCLYVSLTDWLFDILLIHGDLYGCRTAKIPMLLLQLYKHNTNKGSGQVVLVNVSQPRDLSKASSALLFFFPQCR